MASNLLYGDTGGDIGKGNGCCDDDDDDDVACLPLPLPLLDLLLAGQA